MALQSAEDIMAQANKLFVDEEYEDALAKYNLAIELEDGNASYFVSRAACKQQLGQENKNDDFYMEACEDAKKAIEIDPKNVKAKLRLAIAQFSLKEYLAAKITLESALKIDSTNSTVKKWLRKCEVEIEEEADSDDDLPAATPSNPIQSAPAPAAALKPVVDVDVNSRVPSTSELQGRARIRHDWIQTDSFVSLSIFKKGVKREDITLDVTETDVSVTIRLESGSEYQLQLDLCDEIVPSECKVITGSVKVEVKLKKKNRTRWPNLEAGGGVAVPWDGQAVRATATATAKAQPTSTSSSSSTSTAPKRPAYPSSSKKQKNWDAIAAEADGDGDQEGQDALNKLFQDIFAKGDPDTRKAMEKSFRESGGTVLSTNWSDVGKRKVEGSAPDGMEMHSWKEAYEKDKE